MERKINFDQFIEVLLTSKQIVDQAAQLEGQMATLRQRSKELESEVNALAVQRDNVQATLAAEQAKATEGMKRTIDGLESAHRERARRLEGDMEKIVLESESVIAHCKQHVAQAQAEEAEALRRVDVAQDTLRRLDAAIADARSQ